MEKLEVVSLFSGCGGLDLGFKKAGYKIVWANDFDRFAVETYRANFGDHIICDDINNIDLDNIPFHDVLLAGFPCQPFSMMGKELGFQDVRGALFFKIVDIIKNQISRGNKPKVLVLENVRTLRTHNNGETFRAILNTLTHDLGYKVFVENLNSADFGIPQTRNRTYIVCFSDNTIDFEFPKPIPLSLTLQDLLEKEVDDKYFLSEKILKTILAHGSGNFKSKSEIDLKIARPLTATMAKMHRACQDNYVTQKGRVRRLTPKECARLQGFGDDFVIPVSDTQAYKQFGNAVTVNVSYSIAKQIKKTFSKLEDENLVCC